MVAPSLPTAILTEFAASAISPELAQANIRWISGPEAVEEFLESTIAQRQKNDSYLTTGNTRLLKRYEFIELGAWIAYGECLDGSPAEVPYLKPAAPRWDEERGRWVKYETPPGLEAKPLLPNLEPRWAEISALWSIERNPGESCWQALIRHPQVPVIVTEGFKKALALVELGFPAIALRGVSQWHPKESRTLWPEIAALVTKRQVTVAFDQDIKASTRKAVTQQGLALATAIEQAGGQPSFAEWDGRQGKGIDDALVALDPEQRQSWALATIEQALSPADKVVSFADWLAQADSEGELTDWNGLGLYRLLRRLSLGADDAGGLWLVIALQARLLLNSLLSAQQVRPLADAPIGEFSPLTLPQGGERRMVILNGQKGTAKTSSAIQGLIEAAKSANQPTATYAPTRFLSRDTSARLGTTCHLDPEADTAAFITTCPESAHKLVDRDWPIIAIDEANEVLPRSWEGSLGQSPSKAREAITDQLSKAQMVVLAQDGIYQPVIDAVARIGGFSPSQIEYIDLRRRPTEMAIQLYQGTSGGLDFSYHGWLEQLIEAIQRGEKVAIPTGSRGQGRKIHRLLRRIFPEKQGFCIDGRDSFAKMRSQFAESPDGWIAQHQPDWLIFTPVFNSGVSIEQPYFTAQFEYSSPQESASAASQRGERVRAAIGGGLITERHIFLQRRGMPSSPPLEVLRPEYWQEVLTREGAVEGAVSTLRAAGLKEAADRLAAGHRPPVEDYPELAAVLAIQAREIHLKAECLQAEWLGNGWEIIQGEPASELIAMEQAALLSEIHESDLGSRARTLGKAPSQAKAEQRHRLALAAWQGNQEPRGPIEAARQQRWDMENRLGAITLLDDPEFWAACHLENRETIGQAQLAALLKLQWEQPELWAQIQNWKALKAVALTEFYAPLVGNIPALPASHRLLSLAVLLGQCPGIREVIEGTLSQWDKTNSLVLEAWAWAVKNAQAIASLTKTNQRIRGYQFTAHTPAVTAFHRLLGMAGIEAQHQSQARRRHQYRPQTAEDVAEAIRKASQQGKPISHRKRRELWRAEHRDEIIAAALEQAQWASGAARATGWERIREVIAAKEPPTQRFSVDLSVTEVLCRPRPHPFDFGSLAEFVEAEADWLGNQAKTNPKNSPGLEQQAA